MVKRCLLHCIVCVVCFAAISQSSSSSGNQFFNQLAAGLRQLFKPTAVKIGQFIVVQTHQPQQRHVEIADGVDAFDRFFTDFIRRTDVAARR